MTQSACGIRINLTLAIALKICRIIFPKHPSNVLPNLRPYSVFFIAITDFELIAMKLLLRS